MVNLEVRNTESDLRDFRVRVWVIGIVVMLMLGLIILLRGALTFLIHWEIKGEESRLKKEERANAENE